MEEPNELTLYGTTFGTAQGEIRWDIVAQGLGCHGEYVERIEDLDAALRRAREHDGPSLVCLRTDHDANLAIPGRNDGPLLRGLLRAGEAGHGVGESPWPKVSI